MSMLAIDPETYERLNRLLDQALDLSADERGRWLNALPAEHSDLKTRLEALLEHAGARAETPIDTLPKVTAAAPAAAESAETSGTAGDAIGPYRLVRLLGEGGMGSVWLADRADGLLQRAVALKLPRGIWSRPELAARIARERAILASLNHPHIARLYDAGLTESGQPYLALEYVEGVAIDVYARERVLGIRARLELFLQIAEAVMHAHAQLIVHRDLKPSNILVTERAEVRLLDFGIAKLLGDGNQHDSALTRLSGRALTLAYASPEQVLGEPIGLASDVYSLGVVLYELLTGASPYKPARGTQGALEDAVLHAQPVRPSEAAAGDRAVSRQLRGDLDTILLKALKKQPEHRYPTINAFADDVRRHLDGRPVLAQPDSAAYRLRKFVARNRLAVAAAVLIWIAILGGAGVALWQTRIAVAEKERAETVKEFIFSVFRNASPYVKGDATLSAIDLLKQAEDEMERRPDLSSELRAELFALIGSSMIGLEDFEAAEQLLQRAVKEAAEKLGPEDERTRVMRVHLVEAYRPRGKTEEMKTELATLIPELRSAPEQQAVLVRALVCDAHLSIDQGRYADAQTSAREAFELSTAINGEMHPNTVSSSLLLAVSLQYGGSPPEAALEAGERAFRLAERANPENTAHPRVIDARGIYGRALGNAGRLEEGVAQLEQVVADAAKTLGPETQMIAFYSSDLAKYYIELGEAERAYERADRGFQLISKLAKPGSFSFAGSIYRRGTAQLAARRLAEAEADLGRSAAEMDRAVGPTHARAVLAHVLHAQAAALLSPERIEDAKREIAAALKTPEEATSLTAYAAGVVHRLGGEHAAAITWQQRALSKIKEGALGERERMRVLTELGLAQLESGELEQAKHSLENARVLFERHLKVMTPERADMLTGLGRVRLESGDRAGAVQLFESADMFWRPRAGDPRSAQAAAVWLARAKNP